MAALSSMTKMRRFASGAELATDGLGIAAGQVENECRAEARPIAQHTQRTAQFLSGERPAMQAEAVSVHAGGEAVREQAGHVFRGNADPIVDHANTHAGRRLLDPQSKQLVRSARFVACV